MAGMVENADGLQKGAWKVVSGLDRMYLQGAGVCRNLWACALAQEWGLKGQG